MEEIVTLMNDEGTVYSGPFTGELPPCLIFEGDTYLRYMDATYRLVNSGVVTRVPTES